MAFQTDYSFDAEAGVEGALYSTAGLEINSFRADVAVNLGRPVLINTDDSVKAITAVTADTDSIMTTDTAMGTAPTTISSGAFNGVIGASEIVPAQQITFELNNHADWNLTKLIATGLVDGQIISEVVSIPDAGNTTVKTRRAFDRLIDVVVDAQAGTAAQILSIGTEPLAAEFSTRHLLGLPLWQSGAAPFTDNQYAADEQVSLAVHGEVQVVPSAGVTETDPVYVQIVVSGGIALGRLTSAKSANVALWRGAKFIKTASADGLSAVRF